MCLCVCVCVGMYAYIVTLCVCICVQIVPHRIDRATNLLAEQWCVWGSSMCARPGIRVRVRAGYIPTPVPVPVFPWEGIGEA